jgi:tetratricopeptide (TPR) repeat protein
MRLSGDLEGALEGIREARRSLEGAQISSELRRRTVWFSVLWREGVILGEDGSISLDRPAEAIPVLERAFDLIEEWAGKDPDDASSRMLFVNGGGALGNVLRDRDPKRALAVYDLSLRRLGEIKSNIKARRGEAEILAHSSYALRRLNRPREAQDRIDRALKLLRETKDYPDSRVNLGNEADIALRALADHQVGVGQPGKAAGIYQELLDKIRASKPDPEHDLRQAILLSRLYENLGAAHRRSGQPGQAEAMSVLRLELWRHWQTRLPQNSFVTRQLTAAARP